MPANPATEKHLITLTSAIAKQNDGTVVADNIANVPDRTSLGVTRERGAHDAVHDFLERLLCWGERSKNSRSGSRDGD